MRGLLLFLMTLILLLGGVAAGAYFYGGYALTQPGPLADHKDVVIDRGQGLRGIAATLENQGVIRNQYVFLGVARAFQRRALKAGEYDFPANAPIAKVLDMMAKGEVVVHKVTIPEGLTGWQIVQILDKIDGLTGIIDSIPPEGSLLPQTYSFLRGDTKQHVIERMREAMVKTLNPLWAARDPSLPFKSPAEAVTLASIVEKETGVPGERARVAGVFFNRLKQGMPLQSDPTVIYALTQGQIQQNGMGPLGRALTTADLETPSPYNTYKNVGLPPGAIANPGAQALAAVLQPEHNDYLYFVASGTGGHVFATTLEEHNQNVAHWRQIRQQGEHPVTAPIPAGSVGPQPILSK
jgi:UPF0755 protein